MIYSIFNGSFLRRERILIEFWGNGKMLNDSDLRIVDINFEINFDMFYLSNNEILECIVLYIIIK